MVPLQENLTGHDGVFLVAENRVNEYMRRFNPQVLRYDKRAKSVGNEGLNFGTAKGLQFNRVLIVPTGPIKKYLETGDAATLTSKEKLYVAVTRARHSVAFVFDGKATIDSSRFP